MRLTVAYRTRSGPFSSAQLRLLNGVDQQAAIALENIRLVEDLQPANRLKSDFFSAVSHSAVRRHDLRDSAFAKRKKHFDILTNTSGLGQTRR